MLASALGGCSDNVVVKPVALKPVNPSLMRPMNTPKCDLQVKTASASYPAFYEFEEVDASRVCWRTAFGAARTRHNSLVSAVRLRERATAQAVQASN